MQYVAVCLQYVVLCLQYVAVCCSVLQCVAVCCMRHGFLGLFCGHIHLRVYKYELALYIVAARCTLLYVLEIQCVLEF